MEKKTMERPSRVVVDTSVIINGQINRRINAGELRNCEIIVPQAVVDKLYSQASEHRRQGWDGLRMVQEITKGSNGTGISATIHGNHATNEDIAAGDDRVSSIVVDTARRLRATLYTADALQQLTAQAEGVEATLISTHIEQKDLEFISYFDSNTMSIHLKEGMPPMAKRGGPGSFIMVAIEEEPLTKEKLNQMTVRIMDAVRSTNGMVEMEKPGAVVVQYEDYRIAITRPPFSEAVEITIVHPLVRLTLDDYDLSDDLLARFTERAEGIVISGPPGSGKSTLASSLADFYNNRGRIVKTFESPRDLQVAPGITQYTKLDGSFENSAELLLLVRLI